MPTRKLKTKPVEISPSLPQTQLAEQQFYDLCGLTADHVEASGLTWEELAAIYDDQVSKRDALEDSASYIVGRLRKSPKAHSVRSRVKSPASLIHKIIRKRAEGRDITFANYRREITDLVGIRTLHLYKEDWLPIHQFIICEWATLENPIAYVRDGDKAEWNHAYEKNGCRVEKHPRKYRSLHYLINGPGALITTIAEIQVRTLFEEAWSEIDHQVNYPETASNEIVVLYLDLFNRYAGSADEMGSLLPMLVRDLRAFDSKVAEFKAERDKAVESMENVLKKSQLHQAEKDEMAKELAKLRATQLPTPAFVWGGSAYGDSFYGVAPNRGGLPRPYGGALNLKQCTRCHQAMPLTLGTLSNGECDTCRTSPGSA
ncbi:MAG: RelA/SpoT domain-containing protein [Pyrinomonadaceae bacterium]